MISALWLLIGGLMMPHPNTPDAEPTEPDYDDHGRELASLFRKMAEEEEEGVERRTEECCDSDK